MKRLIFILTLLFGAAVQAQAEQPTPGVFAREMVALIHRAAPKAHLRIDSADPLHLTLRLKPESGEDQGEQQIYLNRIFEYCAKASVADCSSTKERFVRGMTDLQRAVTLKSLRIIVRNSDYATAIAAMRDKDGQPTAFTRQLGDGLYMILAADAPDTIAMVNAGGLDELGITEEQAWDLAAIQTRVILPRLPNADAIRKAWQGFQGGDYLGSMAIDLEGWQALADAVGPDMFITVASDQVVIVGTLADGPDLTKLAEAVRGDCEAAPRCISPHVYRFRDGQWKIAP